MIGNVVGHALCGRIVNFLLDDVVNYSLDLGFGIGLGLSYCIVECGVDASLDGFIFVFEVCFELHGFVCCPPGVDFGLC